MIIENKDQLIDIYDIWYEPFWHHGWFITFINICICVIVLGCMFFFYKKYIQKTVVIDCSIVAYRDLDTLEKFHIVTERDSKDCYFSLSSILKRYLTLRYHSTFTQLTDKEIIQQAGRYMTNDNLCIVQQLLQGMVLVKFEHEIAANQKLKKDIQLIKEIIQNTSPQHDTKEF